MAKAKKELSPIRGNQVEVLKLLQRHGELTRSQLSKKLDGAFIGSNMMGHLSGKVQPGSLLGRGYVKAATYPDKETEAEGPVHYDITAAGKKALEEALERPAKSEKKVAAKKKAAKKVAAKKGPPKPLRKEPAAETQSA